MKTVNRYVIYVYETKDYKIKRVPAGVISLPVGTTARTAPAILEIEGLNLEYKLEEV